MKLQSKTLALAYVLILSIGTILSLYIPKNEVTASEAVVIPKEAIRLRILANSDLEADQALKRKVRDEVNANITNWVQELTSINDARHLIKSKLPEIQMIAESVVKKEGSTQTVHVEFGKVQFPTKLYGQFLYPAGEYEAILITLGEGKGANWWCVLFPPLCFLDFSNGVAVSEGFEGKAEAAAPAKQQQTVVENTQPTVQTVEKVETPTTPTQAANQTTQVASELKEQAVVTEPVKQEAPVLKVEEEVKAPAVVTKPQVEKAPVYVEEKEQKVEVKFFLKELWLKIF